VVKHSKCRWIYTPSKQIPIMHRASTSTRWHFTFGAMFS